MDDVPSPPEFPEKFDFQTHRIRVSPQLTNSKQRKPDAAPFWPMKKTQPMQSASVKDDSSFLRRPPKIVDGFGKQLCNFHVFNQCLEEGKLPDNCVGALALAKLENIPDLQAPANVHNLQDKPFALVIWNHKRDLSDTPQDAVRRWVLTERHGALCMSMMKLGNTMQNLPAEPKVNKTVHVKVEDVQTVRFSIRKELAPTEWMTARKDPAKYVQHLLPA